MRTDTDASASLAWVPNTSLEILPDEALTQLPYKGPSLLCQSPAMSTVRMITAVQLDINSLLAEVAPSAGTTQACRGAVASHGAATSFDAASPCCSTIQAPVSATHTSHAPASLTAAQVLSAKHELPSSSTAARYSGAVPQVKAATSDYLPTASGRPLLPMDSDVVLLGLLEKLVSLDKTRSSVAELSAILDEQVLVGYSDDEDAGPVQDIRGQSFSCVMDSADIMRISCEEDEKVEVDGASYHFNLHVDELALLASNESSVSRLTYSSDGNDGSENNDDVDDASAYEGSCHACDAESCWEAEHNYRHVDEGREDLLAVERTYGAQKFALDRGCLVPMRSAETTKRPHKSTLGSCFAGCFGSKPLVLQDADDYFV